MTYAALPSAVQDFAAHREDRGDHGAQCDFDPRRRWRSGVFFVCVLSVLACLSGSPLRAQDEVASKGEILKALKSPNSFIRHETWKRLNPEDRSHWKRLLYILKTKPWYDRDGAISALAKAFSPEVLDRMVKELDKNKDPAIRQAMAKALAEMNDPKYYEKIYEALDDKDPTVRRMAAYSLRVRKKPEAVDALIARFQEEEDPVVNNFIENALNDITQAYRGPDPAIWLAWWELAKQDPDYKLGEIDEEAKKAAEDLGRKLKKGRTVSAIGGVTVDTVERGIGNGVPILVLPQYGQSKETMIPFLSALERRHKVIYIELPPITKFEGLTRAGQTDVPFYPIDKLVGAFEDMRKEREQEHFAILACGLNTWIAMRFAEKYPESVAAMLLVAPYSGNRAFGKASERFIRQGEAKKDLELTYVGFSRSFNTQTGESTLDAKHKEDADRYPVLEGESGCIDRRAWSLHFADDRDGVLSMLYPIHHHSVGGRVAIPKFECLQNDKLKKRVPTLVFAGKKSLHTSVDDCKAVAKHYGGRCLVYSNTSNMPFIEESRRFNKDVAGFLKKYTRVPDDKSSGKKKRRKKKKDIKS